MRGFQRSIKSRQRLVHMIPARIDGTGTASILEGGTELTLTDNGTGDYTLTFDEAFARVPVVVATPVTANIICQIFAVSTTEVQIKTFQAADGVTATDADFHVMIMGFDAADKV